MVTYRIDQLVVNHPIASIDYWKHAGTYTLAQANREYGKVEFQEMQQGHLPNFVVTPIASNGLALQEPMVWLPSPGRIG